jgi:hypothetical protein
MEQVEEQKEMYGTYQRIKGMLSMAKEVCCSGMEESAYTNSHAIPTGTTERIVLFHPSQDSEYVPFTMSTIRSILVSK